MSVKINTAIIPVAGYGSRMLPITKSVEKYMLPVLNRPIIDYVVTDCILAGVNNIIFVVSEGSTQLKQYYSDHLVLEKHLADIGKHALIETIKAPKNIKFTYIEQPADGKYGTAIPIAIAGKLVKNQAQVLVLMGDDFIYNQDGSSEVARLINCIKTDQEAGMLGASMPKEELGNYGVIKANNDGIFEAIIEKPDPKKAPSDLINISKYIFPSDLMQQIANYASSDKINGEYMITEPINQWVKSGGVMRVCRVKGKYLDGGNPENWLAANNYVAKHSK